MKVEFSGRKFH